jgi:hypothetical protein
LIVAIVIALIVSHKADAGDSSRCFRLVPVIPPTTNLPKKAPLRYSCLRKVVLRP